jgi:site-specific DNA recombinase
LPSIIRAAKERRDPYYRCQRVYCKQKDVRKEVVEGEYEEFLKTLEPKRQAVALVEAVLKDAWESRVRNQGKVLEGHSRQLEALNKEKTSTVNKMVRVEQDAAIKALEQRLVVLEAQIAQTEQVMLRSDITAESYGTALGLVLGVIKCPVFIWQNGGYQGKRLVTRLVFVENPVYDRELAYGTAELSVVVKLFDLIQGKKLHDVEMGGVEPPCN